MDRLKRLRGNPLTPAQRKRLVQRVECRFVLAFVAIILWCFLTLKRQRQTLPHDMRVSGIGGIASGRGQPRRDNFHILHVVVDDLGFADVGWRLKLDGQQEVLGARNGLAGDDAMPFITGLRQEGVSLGQFYTPKV